VRHYANTQRLPLLKKDSRPAREADTLKDFSRKLINATGYDLSELHLAFFFFSCDDDTFMMQSSNAKIYQKKEYHSFKTHELH